MWTLPFAQYVAPARARPELWRVGVGIVLITAIYGATIMSLFAAVAVLAGPADLDRWMLGLADGTGPVFILIILATFAGLALGPAVAVRALHARSPRTLLGPDWTAPFAVAAAATLVLGLAAIVLVPRPFDLVPNTDAGTWLAFLVPALGLLLVQTGAEEVAFRGYLQQQLAARFDHPAAWMVLPSVGFGMLHYDPAGTGPNAWLIVAATTLFGLLAADLTRVSGNIGAAWGMHFANNVVALLIVGVQGSLSGLSLWTTPFGTEDAARLPLLLGQDMAMTVIIWATIRLWMARRGLG
ncbi:type II CAAX endopeptidase family protein [Jannaschia sp. LMIT008]|uniref:CPBP family intramembrane glutamic endopeptidase n=1 Tax=Jannaschia maritima TaxID=3032585 RepID=UPI0028117B3C|nr:type II CAAX endopeptidase family protein [Jannaschia sp. LMIT008]